MSDQASTERPPSERVHDLPQILDEMRAAVREALARSKRLGNPVVVWRGGQVVWLSPDQIPEPEHDRGVPEG